ncbi:MAG: hypothetical protein AUK47_04790 [Deltaproteobacteria bacterium CG2_30_63_29]|nr:MAG: hypothetical protein AUK47_04790 [Deltaproteobacteria bacterium CG2_30_63_29]PJB42961.1 MAG: hypothetical protein CO108_10895 [Deltaproteobacteria bacterium CG_4_9_14_3_um_filter_63_12]
MQRRAECDMRKVFLARLRRSLSESVAGWPRLTLDLECHCQAVLGRQALRRPAMVVSRPVDLSQVVDKYIGETEKNLGRVFDEAERAQAVLLFDEADALFATRTAVKSSNDRCANLEVNYLLQRLEAFNGMSILTTNFASSIDDAFQRRIRHIIEFPMPDADGRAALWQTLLPESAPLAHDLDFEMLGAAFELSGGHIRNAIFRAALRAADGDRAIAHALPPLTSPKCAFCSRTTPRS